VPRDLGPDLEAEVREGPPPPLDGFAPIDVWLEFDPASGHIAAWVPSVPGVLAIARSRDRAQTAALTRTGRVRAWLEAHGDEAGIPRIWRPQVAAMEETHRFADGSEVHATFPPDRRAVSQEEVATALRRLGWARDDLLAMAGAIEAWEAGGGPLPVDAVHGERTLDEVLRHHAGLEAWLVGRLPGGGRYEGPRDDGPARDALAASRAWVMDRLELLGRADDGAEITDPRGETWTLAKVLRRLQGHGLEQLWDLQRRLVRVDGTASRVEVVLDRVPETGRVVELLRSVGWDLRASEPASLERAIAGTPEFATAWDGDRLIGTARSITDGGQNALIATVVVDPAYQGLGVGERMMALLTDGRDLVRFSLAAAPGIEAWYRKLGFLPDPHAMFRPRRRR
jgi:hypothetical protein